MKAGPWIFASGSFQVSLNSSWNWSSTRCLKNIIWTGFGFLTSIKSADDMKFLSHLWLGLLFTFLACLMTGDRENIFHCSVCYISWTSLPEPYLPSLTSSTIVPVFNHSLYHGAALYISGRYYCQDSYWYIYFPIYIRTHSSVLKGKRDSTCHAPNKTS